MVRSKGIALKKKYGQHFLRDQAVLHAMINRVRIDSTSSVFEIGCGEGVLTQEILQTPAARVWVFEIDEQWADHVAKKYGTDTRLTMHTTNVLDVDFAAFAPHAPWTLLANLPYQVTFPILHLLQRNSHLLKEGVIMVQEEVAQKIIKTGGRGYGYSSLFFQHYFDWELMNKIPPSAFYPPPKVHSRLLYFVPKNPAPLPNEQEFWKFIKICFHQPRRTLKNNLSQSHYDLSLFDTALLGKRAQQLSMDDLLAMWRLLNPVV